METEQNLSIQETPDLKEIFLKLKHYWKAILLCFFIAFTIAIIISHYTKPLYEVSASLLVKKEKPLIDLQNSPLIENIDEQYEVKNEIEILKAAQITERALSRLNFGISYFQKIPFSMLEIYKHSPFIIIPDSSISQPTDALFKVVFLSDSTYCLSADFADIQLRNLYSQEASGYLEHYRFKGNFKCNISARSDKFSFVLKTKNSRLINKYVIGKTYFFSIRSKESLIREYRNYDIADFRNSTVIKVTSRGNNIDKIVDFLNTLCEVYLDKSVEKKYISSANTINFIQNQLFDVADSLKYSENKLQEFQSTNKIMNMDFQSQQVFVALDNLQNRKAELLTKQKYFLYLKNFLEKNDDVKNFIAPSAIGIDDVILNSMMNELVNVLNDRAEITSNVKKENPYVSSYDTRVENLKKSVCENVNNLIDASNISIKEIDDRLNMLSYQASKLPEKQKELFGFERLYKLNDDLYTYLLTKRSDIQISKAALLPDNEVINEANSRDAVLVAPLIRKNILIALLLGLGIPILIILLKDYFSERIREIKDIEKSSDYTILGHIVHDKSSYFIPVFDDSKSLIAESFRSIRTNFQFIAPINEKHTILITSSMMDEGKSFTSINLAASFALFGKRTALLCFDLRKPLQNIPFSLTNNKGISTYLSGNCEIENIIQSTPNENLNIILPGPLPPNPNELIASSRTSEMISTLKNWFDYIVIDTPPVGMVADAMLLLNYSNVNLFMVRHNKTLKNIFQHIMNTFKKRNIPNVNIIVNDLPVPQNGYGYNYNYGYNYGYGYYNNEKKNILNRIFEPRIFKSNHKKT